MKIIMEDLPALKTDLHRLNSNGEAHWKQFILSSLEGGKRKNDPNQSIEGLTLKRYNNAAEIVELADLIVNNNACTKDRWTFRRECLLKIE